VGTHTIVDSQQFLYHILMMDRSNKREHRADDGESLLFGLETQRHPDAATRLREGVLLMDLVRAIMSVRGTSKPPLPFAWRGQTLTHLSDAGDMATLDFSGSDALILARAAASNRNPSLNNGRSYFTSLTNAVPKILRPTMELHAVAFKHETDKVPWITAVLWSENGVICTPGSLESFLEHAGVAVERLFLEHRVALRGYQRSHGLSDEGATLAASIFERKRVQPNDWLLLTENDYAQLIAQGSTGLSAANEILLANRIHQPYRPSPG
jgi:hypothetical protein